MTWDWKNSQSYAELRNHLESNDVLLEVDAGEITDRFVPCSPPGEEYTMDVSADEATAYIHRTHDGHLGAAGLTDEGGVGSVYCSNTTLKEIAQSNVETNFVAPDEVDDAVVALVTRRAEERRKRSERGERRYTPMQSLDGWSGKYSRTDFATIVRSVDQGHETPRYMIASGRREEAYSDPHRQEKLFEAVGDPFALPSVMRIPEAINWIHREKPRDICEIHNSFEVTNEGVEQILPDVVRAVGDSRVIGVRSHRYGPTGENVSPFHVRVEGCDDTDELREHAMKVWREEFNQKWNKERVGYSGRSRDHHPFGSGYKDIVAKFDAAQDAHESMVSSD